LKKKCLWLKKLQFQNKDIRLQEPLRSKWLLLIWLIRLADSHFDDEIVKVSIATTKGIFKPKHIISQQSDMTHFIYRMASGKPLTSVMGMNAAAALAA
jgi:hypothetical protein